VEGRDAIVAAIKKSVERQEFLVQVNCAVVIDLRDAEHASAHSTVLELGRDPGGKGMQVVAFTTTSSSTKMERGSTLDTRCALSS
jgi:hypothetical protein